MVYEIFFSRWFVYGGGVRHTCRAEGKGVIIVEGILIFTHPELRELLDVKVFVDTVRIYR